MRPWYEEHPSWLAEELDALASAGIHYSRDEASFAAGIARLRLEMNVPDVGIVKLVATYPESYPYFRFEVQSDELDLAHHQNPFAKNLCLLARDSRAWETRDTVAGVLNSQLPKAIAAAAAKSVEHVRGLEVAQAEPIGVYYPYAPRSIVIVPGAIAAVPMETTSGTMKIAVHQPQERRPPRDFKGAVVELSAPGKGVIAKAEQSIRRAFPGPELQGVWARLPHALRQDHPKRFLEKAIVGDGRWTTAPANAVAGGTLRIWAFLYPEEVGHRAMGQGWLFLCLFDKDSDRYPGRAASRKSDARRKR